MASYLLPLRLQHFFPPHFSISTLLCAGLFSSRALAYAQGFSTSFFSPSTHLPEDSPCAASQRTPAASSWSPNLRSADAPTSRPAHCLRRCLLLFLLPLSRLPQRLPRIPLGTYTVPPESLLTLALLYIPLSATAVHNIGIRPAIAPRALSTLFPSPSCNTLSSSSTTATMLSLNSRGSFLFFFVNFSYHRRLVVRYDFQPHRVIRCFASSTSWHLYGLHHAASLLPLLTLQDGISPTLCGIRVTSLTCFASTIPPPCFGIIPSFPLRLSP